MLRTIWPKYFLLGKKQARNPGRLRKGLQIAVVGSDRFDGMDGTDSWNWRDWQDVGK